MHATEPSNASRTMLFDIRSLDWSDELSGLFGVPASCLPEVRPSAGRFGVTAPGTPLPGIPVAGIPGDQQAALFGQACFAPGMTKNTYGTGSFVLMNVGPECPEPVEGLLTTVAWTGVDDGPTYALEGAIFVTGAAVQWLRDGLGVIDDAAAMGPLAASCADTGGVYLVPAFTGLGSPWWDPYARGTIVGHHAGHHRRPPRPRRRRGDGLPDPRRGRGHDRGRGPDRSASCGSTAARRPWTCSCSSRPTSSASRWPGPWSTRPPRSAPPTSPGLAEGVWSSTDELASLWQLDLRCEPAGDRDDADRRHLRWREAVDPLPELGPPRLTERWGELEGRGFPPPRVPGASDEEEHGGDTLLFARRSVAAISGSGGELGCEPGGARGGGCRRPGRAPRPGGAPGPGTACRRARARGPGPTRAAAPTRRRTPCSPGERCALSAARLPAR